MTNKEAIEYLKEVQSHIDLENGGNTQKMYDAIDMAIKALEMVEQLENMRDNLYRLYEAENGNDDYSYGRMQALGTVHSDLEELLEEFDGGGRK